MKKAFLFLLVILLVLAMTACVGTKKDDPTVAMQNMTAVMNGDYSNLKELAPQKFWDWEQQNNLNYADYWEDFNEEYRSGALGQYGMDAKYSITINSTTMLERTDSRFQKIAEFLNKIYSITEEELEAVCYMSGTNYINGSKKSNSYDHTYIATKINGKWYPMNGSGNDFYIGFVGNLAN